MATVLLGNGDDVYISLFGTDIVLGNAGDDKITTTVGGAEVYGGFGNDTLIGGLGDDYLVGDDLNGGNDRNVITGGGGNDTIVINSNRDVVNAGAGDDTVEVWAQITGQSVQGGTGIDLLELFGLQTRTLVTVSLSASFQPVVGNLAGATYTGFERLSFVGGSGQYNVTGGALADRFVVNDNYAAKFAAGVFDGLGGADLFLVGGVTTSGIHQVLGGSGNDQLEWRQGQTSVGNLVVDAVAGTISSSGRQFLSFTSIEELRVTSSDVASNLDYLGFGGVDVVAFDGLSSRINTQGGDDRISVGQGKHRVNAGDGDDSVVLTGQSTSTASLSGGLGDDNLSGGVGNATLLGGAGNDTLYGANNRDVFDGGAGNDTVTRQASFIDAVSSSGTLNGGGGIDRLTLNFNIVSVTITADFSAGNVILYDGSTVTGFEIVSYSGGYGVDIITSSAHILGASVNLVNGASGNDVLTASAAGAALNGGYGDDRLVGGASRDLLAGEAGNDRLLGGDGNDRLTGGIGKDLLSGGLGADSFVFGYFAESGTLATTRDVIQDFRRNQGDKIDLAGIDAVNSTVGVDERFVFSGSAFTGVAGQLIYQKFDLVGTVNDYTLVSGDITGGGVANFTIQVAGLIDFQARDFLL